MTRIITFSPCRIALTLLGCLPWMVVPSVAQTAEPAPSREALAFFESKVRPVLVEHCHRCHGLEKQRGGLRADSRAALLQGGDQGPVLVPGDADKSLFIKAINYDDEDLQMPPKGKLPREHIANITRWVKMGAPWPGDAGPIVSKPRTTEPEITDKDRAHWAFQPVKRPSLPAVKNPRWVANPIDAFLLARLEAAQLIPSPPADRRELIRRLTYDLTGLPPTPAEVDAFLGDTSPQAYENLVDRLLDSPRYGEKWARYWLDLVRFAETNSYERDNPKPNAWRYRDYVIRAFNDDKPYDRFILEQLAGDELPDGGAEGVIATGFYRLGIWDDEPTDRDQAFYDGIDDIVATTSQTFLGLTMDCARCHGHKLDPIPQSDYYRMAAFFRNINHFRNGGPTDEMRLVRTSEGELVIEPLDGKPKNPRAQRKEQLQTVLCITEAGTTAPDTHVLIRGNPSAKGEKVAPGFPQVFGVPDPIIPTPGPEDATTGRRLALAQWIASKDNPLTARVMANRLWQYHFGRGLVRSASNFGLQGDKPTHPDLLNWLASEFVRQGWRMKPLHRLIVTSNAYQMSSRPNDAGIEADPVNDLFWRFDMRRLSAEEIRDSVLAVSGNLNLAMYGAGIYPEIPPEVLAGQSQPGYGWGKSSPEEQARRSVYIHVKRSLLVPILEAFDLAETDHSFPIRFASTQPTQALMMLNSAFLNQQAALFADRLQREAGTDTPAQVRLALKLATAREPRDEEIHRGVALIDTLQQEEGVSEKAARAYFCLLVLNLNEFFYLD